MFWNCRDPAVHVKLARSSVLSGGTLAYLRSNAGAAITGASTIAGIFGARGTRVAGDASADVRGYTDTVAAACVVADRGGAVGTGPAMVAGTHTGSPTLAVTSTVTRTVVLDIASGSHKAGVTVARSVATPTVTVAITGAALREANDEVFQNFLEAQ